jgi:hypothetical protein
MQNPRVMNANPIRVKDESARVESERERLSRVLREDVERVDNLKLARLLTGSLRDLIELVKKIVKRRKVRDRSM